jgi:hypothetical protein
MAILPAGSDIHGYPTRRFRVRVRNLTRGSYPYPTRDKIGSGTGLTFYPRVLADIRNFQFLFFQPTRNRPAQPNATMSFIQSPATLVSLSPQPHAQHKLKRSSQKPPAAAHIFARKQKAPVLLLIGVQRRAAVLPHCRPSHLSLPHCRPSHLPHCPAPRRRTTAEVPTLLLVGVRLPKSLPASPPPPQSKL